MRRKSWNSAVICIGQGIDGHGDPIRIEAAESSYVLSPAEEKDYMERIKSSDRDAFSQVVNLYMTDIHHFAYGILRDSGRAEDIVQETYLRLWSKADQWNPSGRVKSWLLRIAHNLCMDEIRGQKGEIPVDTSALVIPDPYPDQASDHADRQVSWIVKEALFSLPERQRTALMLVYYEGYSNIESADIMGISVDAIESLLARGRQKLKDALSGSKQALLEG